jgi:lysozyme
MMLSVSGLEAIKRREGVRLSMYRDSANLPTIGCGHLLTKDELHSGKVLGEDWRDGISQDTCDRLLQADLQSAMDAVHEFVRVPLLQHQFDTLISLVFNIGDGAFQESTLLRQLNNDQFATVPGQLRRWIYAAGHRDTGLVNRREDEIEQWEGVC